MRINKDVLSNVMRINSLEAGINSCHALHDMYLYRLGFLVFEAIKKSYITMNKIVRF